MDFSVVCVDQRLRNSEAKTETPKPAGDIGLPLFKGVKDLVDRFVFDADSGIDDASFNLIRCRVKRCDSDSTFLRSKFDAVLDQIPKHLLQARRIALDMCVDGVKLKFHFEVLCLNFLSADLVSALQDLVYADRLEA